MKRLHRPDLYCWSAFQEHLNIDFNSFLWTRDGGNVVIDPLPVSAHDAAHLKQLGGVSLIVLTNSDHVRGALSFGAVPIAAPEAEQEGFPITCDRWLGDDEEIVPGLTAVTLDGSKTPGELALVLNRTTLITGDLIRAHRADALNLLPPPKLRDERQAKESIRRLLDQHPAIENVLVGDGWCAFRHGGDMLRALIK